MLLDTGACAMLCSTTTHAYLFIHQPKHLLWTSVAKVPLCSLAFFVNVEACACSFIFSSCCFVGRRASSFGLQKNASRQRAQGCQGRLAKLRNTRLAHYVIPLGATLGGSLRVPAGRRMATCECSAASGKTLAGHIQATPSKVHAFKTTPPLQCNAHALGHAPYPVSRIRHGRELVERRALATACARP